MCMVSVDLALSQHRRSRRFSTLTWFPLLLAPCSVTQARLDMEELTKLVEKEEADELACFEKAKADCIEERRAHRQAKSARASRRRGDRTREANIARREKAKLEREKKSRASIRRREAVRRQRVEAELLDELAQQERDRKAREVCSSTPLAQFSTI